VARLRTVIQDDLMRKVCVRVKQIWPSEDSGALGRFIRDALRRYVRYSKGGRD